MCSLTSSRLHARWCQSLPCYGVRNRPERRIWQPNSNIFSVVKGDIFFRARNQSTSLSSGPGLWCPGPGTVSYANWGLERHTGKGFFLYWTGTERIKGRVKDEAMRARRECLPGRRYCSYYVFFQLLLHVVWRHL